MKVALAAAIAALALPAGAANASVNYGPISHSGLSKVGATSTGLKLTLQIGLVANNSGLHSSVKSHSNPSSSTYGQYPSLSTLQSKFGATSSVRNGVVNAFKSQDVTATIDVTHLRASATISVGKAQKMFGTKWADYRESSGAIVALPVDTPKRRGLASTSRPDGAHRSRTRSARCFPRAADRHAHKAG